MRCCSAEKSWSQVWSNRVEDGKPAFCGSACGQTPDWGAYKENKRTAGAVSCQSRAVSITKWGFVRPFGSPRRRFRGSWASGASED